MSVCHKHTHSTRCKAAPNGYFHADGCKEEQALAAAPLRRVPSVQRLLEHERQRVLHWAEERMDGNGCCKAHELLNAGRSRRFWNSWKGQQRVRREWCAVVWVETPGMGRSSPPCAAGNGETSRIFGAMK